MYKHIDIRHINYHCRGASNFHDEVAPNGRVSKWDLLSVCNHANVYFHVVFMHVFLLYRYVTMSIKAYQERWMFLHIHTPLRCMCVDTHIYLLCFTYIRAYSTEQLWRKNKQDKAARYVRCTYQKLEEIICYGIHIHTHILYTYNVTCTCIQTWSAQCHTHAYQHDQRNATYMYTNTHIIHAYRSMSDHAHACLYTDTYTNAHSHV